MKIFLKFRTRSKIAYKKWKRISIFREAEICVSLDQTEESLFATSVAIMIIASIHRKIFELG